jgi:putative lipoprotein
MKLFFNTLSPISSSPIPKIAINAFRRVFRVVVIAILILSLHSVTFAGRQRANDSFFAVDKAKHLAVSIFISAGTGFVAKNHFGSTRKEAVMIGFGASLSIGGLKELIDISMPEGDPSWKDFAVDVVGSLIGAAIVAGVTK